MREKNKKLLLQNSAKMLVAVLLATGLAGCTDAVKAAETTAETTDISALVASATAGQAGKYDDEDSDATWDAASATAIVWSGASASVSGGGATASGGTVTISAAGTYVLSGTGTGQVVISAGKEDLVRLVLNGLSLTNETGAPVYVEQAEKAVVILADGTTNTLADDKTYTLAEGEDEPDAALFSKADLSITGSGALTVNANYKNGIASKDDLIITDGTITVTAANDGLRGKDSVSILDGILVVNAQGDGIQSNNDAETDKGWVALDGGTFTITAGNDGVQAETDLTVTGGTYDVTTGGGAAAAETHQGDQPGSMGGGNMPQMPTGTEGEMPSPPSGTDGSMPQRPSGMNPPQQAAGTAAATSDTASTDADAAAEETASDSYKAFKAGAMLAVTAGTFTIDAQDDAVHSNGDAVIKGGTFTISTGDDAIHAENALVVSDGAIQIDACYEGLEGATIDILGGDIRLTASDDGLNAAGGESTEQMGAPGAGSADSNYYIRISGGFVLVNADGDGIDANGSLYFDGGTVLVNGPTSDGNAAFDYDSECTVTGGTLIAVGSSGMAQTPGEDSTQAVLSVTYSEAQAAGTLVSLTDSSGKTIVSFTPAKQYKNIVISTPDLAKGNSYTLYSGGADSGTADGGYVAGGTVTGATKKTAVSLSDIITSISDDGTAVTTGGRGFGGNGGGPGSGGNPGNGGMGPGRGGRSGGAQNGQQSASTAATAG
ncbi:MAG: carbohydrate-binding domain-containing protein [Intestinibacillus sp.]